MPTYSYRCPQCDEPAVMWKPIANGPDPTITCPECGTQMRRNYRADNPQVAAVMQETFSPSLGRMISDQRQVTDAMKQITEDSYNRTGYVPDLVAMHRSEIQPAAESHADPSGQALENASRAAHDNPTP